MVGVVLNDRVIVRQVFGADFLDQGIPAVHFHACPVQGSDGLLRAHDDRGQEMGDAVVFPHFHRFRVDHEHTDLVRTGVVEQGDDHGVDADGFALSGGARDQQMRHLSDVQIDRLAGYVFAEGADQLALAVLESRIRNEVAQPHDRGTPVRDLDADGGFAGYILDPDGRRREVQGDVVRQVCDLAHADAGLRLYFVAGDRRSERGADDFRAHFEAFKHFFQFLADGRHVARSGLWGITLAHGQEIDGREYVLF